MLQSRNLDDQSFEQIMEYVTGRLPWLCPAWTDYNAHDPGITILELIAWYKEMQQYHMNTVTPALQKKLLKLLGVVPRPPRPASCLVSPPRDRRLPPLARLESPQGVCFELLEPAQPAGRVEAAYLAGSGGLQEVTEALAQPQLAIRPFAEDGGAQLLIGLGDCGRSLRLWFEIDDQRPVPRNPFASPDQSPRVLQWGCAGASQPPQVEDGTNGLSHSGFITFRFPADFAATDAGRGLPPRPYLTLRQLDAGCEEEIRLMGIYGGYFRAAQQETWANAQWQRLEPGMDRLPLEDAVALEGGVYLFAREGEGLRFLPSQRAWEEGGLCLRFDPAGLPQDGEPNLLVVSQDALRYGQLMFPSTGLPEQSILLPVGERQVLPDRLRLICDTLCPDGQVRPALWECVDDLTACGPRDRVFAYDPVREQVVFGDGAHGAIPPKGEQAVLVASLALSYCGGGNVPRDCALALADGSTAGNTAASGGEDAQSLPQAAAEFLRSLEHTQKCASEADYERAARETPGLRVAAAKAIAGFDPEEPSGRSHLPVVTVVVLPGSSRVRPLPDARFLRAVQEHLEHLRPICTVVKVVAPTYVPVGVSLQARGAFSTQLEGKIREAVERYLQVGYRGRAIGDPVRRDDLAAALMEVEHLLGIQRLELRPLGTGCYADPRGDLQLRRNAVAYLGALDLEIR